MVSPSTISATIEGLKVGVVSSGVGSGASDPTIWGPAKRSAAVASYLGFCNATVSNTAPAVKMTTGTKTHHRRYRILAISVRFMPHSWEKRYPSIEV